jgi:hypothetical protein
VGCCGDGDGLYDDVGEEEGDGDVEVGSEDLQE